MLQQIIKLVHNLITILTTKCLLYNNPFVRNFVFTFFNIGFDYKNVDEVYLERTSVFAK